MLNAISYGIDADRRCLPDLFPFRLWIAAGGCSFVRGSYRGLLLPLMASIYAARLHLQAIKEDAVVVYKALEFERKWASGGYFHHVKVPVLTFELLQSKRQLKFKRLIKHFNSLQVGDAGAIIYKKKNEKYFFVDFVRK